jgi:DedD protein
VHAARTRARRRLIGAAVLVGVGIIGFPLLFETQPRPIAVDIPIVIPSRDNAPPLTLPPTKTPPPAAQAPEPAPAPPPVVAEPAPAAAPASAPPVAAAPPPPPPRPTPDSEAQRAQALLEGKPVTAAADAKPARFVVQAGAYTDAATLREARQKVEKLGLKTYTQVVETESGARTRVRVGPFETREEAEKAAARIKAGGLAANILSL